MPQIVNPMCVKAYETCPWTFADLQARALCYEEHLPEKAEPALEAFHAFMEREEQSIESLTEFQ